MKQDSLYEICTSAAGKNTNMIFDVHMQQVLFV